MPQKIAKARKTTKSSEKSCNKLQQRNKSDGSCVFFLVLPEKISIIGVMKTLTPERQALEEAISVAGGITKLARALNLSSHNVIGQWRTNGVPAKHAPDVEALTGVTCERLCPAVNWAVLRNRDAA